MPIAKREVWYDRTACCMSVTFVGLWEDNRQLKLLAEPSNKGALWERWERLSNYSGETLLLSSQRLFKIGINCLIPNKIQQLAMQWAKKIYLWCSHVRRSRGYHDCNGLLVCFTEGSLSVLHRRLEPPAMELARMKMHNKNRCPAWTVQVLRTWTSIFAFCKARTETEDEHVKDINYAESL